MTAYQSLVSINGTTSRVPAADSLLVGRGVDTVGTSGADSVLTLGAANATEITIKTINGVGTGDITIDAGNGSSNLLSLEGANVTVTTQASGSISLSPGANGNVYIDGGANNVVVSLGTFSPIAGFGFDVRAATVFKNPSDSTTAFQVRDTTSAVVFDVDTSNARVGIGNNAPSTALHVDSNAADTTAILTVENSGGDFQVFRVSATPESAVTGSVGDLANDTANGVLYLKTSGSATNTGWTALSTGGGPATIDFDTSGVLAGDACYASAAGVASGADATTPASPYRAARVLGIATTSNASGKIAVSGLVNATFIGSLTLNVGDPVYLSETAGQLTNDVSAGAGFGTGDAVAEVGIITDTLSYNGTSNFTVEILFQPKSITIL